MEKFVPLEKMSKKSRREFYAKKRKDWNGLDPVTRVARENKKYSRARAKAGLLKSERSIYFIVR